MNFLGRRMRFWIFLLMKPEKGICSMNYIYITEQKTKCFPFLYVKIGNLYKDILMDKTNILFQTWIGLKTSSNQVSVNMNNVDCSTYLHWIWDWPIEFSQILKTFTWCCWTLFSGSITYGNTAGFTTYYIFTS